MLEKQHPRFWRSEGMDRYDPDVQLAAMYVLQFGICLVLCVAVYGGFYWAAAGGSGSSGPGPRGALPEFLGGGGGVSSLADGLLRPVVLASLLLSTVLAWMLDALQGIMIHRLQGEAAAYMLCFRSVPFFVCGCAIFSDSFCSWQVFGCALTFQGIFFYIAVKEVVGHCYPGDF